MEISWATVQDDDGNMLIPFFPRKEFAENCTKNDWEDFEAKAIDLYEFIDNWLVGMKKTGSNRQYLQLNKSQHS